jgi:hypothetical protein
MPSDGADEEADARDDAGLRRQFVALDVGHVVPPEGPSIEPDRRHRHEVSMIIGTWLADTPSEAATRR